MLDADETRTFYLVVETKGYDNMQDIHVKDQRKIESAKRFLQALRDGGTAVHFETPLNASRLRRSIGHTRSPRAGGQP